MARWGGGVLRDPATLSHSPKFETRVRTSRLTLYKREFTWLTLLSPSWVVVFRIWGFTEPESLQNSY